MLILQRLTGEPALISFSNIAKGGVYKAHARSL